MVHVLKYREAAELKKAFEKKFGENVHYHDMCEFQYMSLDTVSDERVAFIEGYFAGQGLEAVFNEARTEFTVEEPEGEK